MSDKFKEEIASLLICLISIICIIALLYYNKVSANMELYTVYITFTYILSCTKPWCWHGIVGCVLPTVLYVMFGGFSNLIVIASTAEVITYFVLGSVTGKSSYNNVCGVDYADVLGYQMLTVAFGGIIWFIAISISIHIGYSFPWKLWVIFIQHVMLIVMHMFACNKPLTNYVFNE